MPRTDPSRSSESATRHLFRHFFDEQELLRNPYVSSALRSGRLTMSGLHVRLADAARNIEAQDQAAGNHRRGARQAAALVECTLKHRPPAEVASELGLSPRQFFRERQAAWTRAVRHLIAPEPSALNEPTLRDLQCNHALRLFASGQRVAGFTLLSEILGGASGLEGVMLAGLGAEMHHAAGEVDAAQKLLARAQSSLYDPGLENSTLCRLTLMLLSDLLDAGVASAPKIRLSNDVADAVFMERGVQWWMIRLATRLLIAKYYRAVALYDRRGALRTAQTAVALGERVPILPEREAFDLRLLAAHVDWSEHGLTARAEAALVGNYLMATANGWLPEVAQVSSLLGAMMIVAGKKGTENYVDTALAVAKLLQEEDTAQFIYLNFAAAELDAGRPEKAATFLESVASGRAREFGGSSSEWDAEYALLAREVKATTRSSQTVQLAVGDPKGIYKLATLDPLRAAYSSRVAAMELERRDDHRAATRLIAEAWEIAAHEGDWFSHRTIGRTYRKMTRASARNPAEA